MTPDKEILGFRFLIFDLRTATPPSANRKSKIANQKSKDALSSGAPF